MRYTLKQLEYFVAAGEAGSIVRASERIHVSQPSISTAISQLEKELNVQLFLRHHAQGLSLTPSGLDLMQEAKRLLEQAEGLYTLAAQARDTVHGKLRVGCLTTLAPMILPEVTLSFTSAFPQTQIAPLIDHQERLFKALRHAEIDLALTYDLQLSDEVDFLPLVDLPVHALVGESHPLANRTTISLKDLAQEPLVFLDLPFSREYFQALFDKEGLSPSIAYRLTQPDVIRTMVANGFGYTLVNTTPRSDQALDGRKLVRIALQERLRPMTLGIATATALRRTRLMQAFLTHVQSIFSRGYVPGMVRPQ